MDRDEVASSAEAKQLRSEIDKLKDGFATDALNIVHLAWPRKILELGKLFTGSTAPEIFQLETLASFHTVPAAETSKKRKADLLTAENVEPEVWKNVDPVRMRAVNTEVLSNKVIVEMSQRLQSHLLDMLASLNTVKVWIQLNIPRIEDGNNFGVGIQEETVSELSRAEDSAFSVLENMTKYYATRAKLVSKRLKYPLMADYAQCIKELDEKEYVNLRLCSIDLRNSYAILYDLVTKNLEKLRKPRTSNQHAMF